MPVAVPVLLCIGVSTLGWAQADGGSLNQSAILAEPAPKFVWPPKERALLGPHPAGRLVEQGPTRVAGGLTSGTIAEDVRRHSREITGCYERFELLRDGKSRGRLTLAIVINATGRAASVRVEENSFADPGMGECIKAGVWTWYFHRPGADGARFSYGFDFEPLHQRKKK